MVPISRYAGPNFGPGPAPQISGAQNDEGRQATTTVTKFQIEATTFGHGLLRGVVQDLVRIMAELLQGHAGQERDDQGKGCELRPAMLADT